MNHGKFIKTTIPKNAFCGMPGEKGEVQKYNSTTINYVSNSSMYICLFFKRNVLLTTPNII